QAEDGIRDWSVTGVQTCALPISKQILLGYAQSWALFRMLMDEEPHHMRTYLKFIYPQRVNERRLADFQQAFGSDLSRLEQRYAAYIKDMVQQYAPAKPESESRDGHGP